MKANEIQIGDCVKLFNGNGEYLIDTIIDIHILNTLCIENQNVLRVEPISLTPEILEKNDLHYSETSGFYLWSNPKGFKEEVKIEHVSGMIWEMTARGKYGNVHISCGYVHQLQHALRLCGVEHEITL